MMMTSKAKKRSLSTKPVKSTFREDQFRLLLHTNLVALKKQLIRWKALKTAHDPLLTDAHIDQTASNIIKTQIQQQMMTLNDRPLSEEEKSIIAYSHTSMMLTDDLAAAVSNSSSDAEMRRLHDDNHFLQRETVRVQTTLSDALARTNQDLHLALHEKDLLEYKNSSLLATVELLTAELEKTKRSLAETEYVCVQQRMQCANAEGAIQRCGERILGKVEAKLGYSPRTVSVEVARLRRLSVLNNSPQQC